MNRETRNKLIRLIALRARASQWVKERHGEEPIILVDDMAEFALEVMKEVIDDRDELQHVFDLQQKRTGKAIRMWRREHGEPLTTPDLGELLSWLMRRRQEKRP